MLRVLIAATLLAGVAMTPSWTASPAEVTQTSLAAIADSSASLPAALVPPPGYFRPVAVAGKVFPVARSNFLSLLQFSNGWHDPRFRFVDGEWKLVGRHEGIDIIAERGTPVLSMTAGTVEQSGWTFYSGTRIGIRGIDGRYYLYAHLSAVEAGIAPGARVSAGSVLGRVGNTGYGAPGHRDSFAPHLHFGIQAAGSSRWVNPYPTLVSLYRAAVQTHSRLESRLRDLGARGRERAWARLLERGYMDLSPDRE